MRLHILLLGFAIGKMGSSTRLYHLKKLGGHVPLRLCLCGCWGSSEPGSAPPWPWVHSPARSTACLPQGWPGSAATGTIWRAALLSPLRCAPCHHLARTPRLHLRTLILDIQCESGDGGLNSCSAPNSPWVSFCSI